MKATLTAIIIISASITLKAQLTWAPTGTTWTYGVAYAFSPLIESRQWICTGDTVVEGYDCKVFQRNGTDVVSDLSDKLITFEEDGIVYWYNQEQFTTLFDINKVAGESWTIMNGDCGIAITVDSTSTEIINGFLLKVLYVSSQDWTWDGKIIEHIGHTRMPNPYFLYTCKGVISDYNWYTGLRCYEDAAFGFHSFNIAPTCDYTNIGVEEKTSPFGMEIFPNPAIDLLRIRTNSAQNISYIIYSVDGKRKASGRLTGSLQTIDITEFPAGLYCVELSASEQIERQCFVVQK